MNQTKESNQRTKTESKTEKANLQLPKGKEKEEGQMRSMSLISHYT